MAVFIAYWLNQVAIVIIFKDKTSIKQKTPGKSGGSFILTPAIRYAVQFS